MGKRRTCIRWLTRRLLETNEHWVASAWISYPQSRDAFPIQRIMQEIRDAGFPEHANFLTLISACAKAEEIRDANLLLEEALRSRGHAQTSYICWKKYGF